MSYALRPGDIVEILRPIHVGRGSLRELRAGDVAMVRFVDEDSCVVLTHGLYVQLPLDAIAPGSNQVVDTRSI